MTKTRFKIFFGNGGGSFSYDGADSKANEWLENHPDISLVGAFYQQARMGDHSICIMYKENQNDS